MSNVLSRIAYVVDHPSRLSQLQTQVVEGLNQIISNLCLEERIKPEEIYQAVVVGNITMSHLFLGIDPTYLAPAPFIPGFRNLLPSRPPNWDLKSLAMEQ